VQRLRRRAIVEHFAGALNGTPADIQQCGDFVLPKCANWRIYFWASAF